ncbi:MAG: glycosyltransferase [Sphingobacteriales bacterium]|uniref:glycosyltransferase n=1 Tax=Hydrotalea flava TaxID=714549 RepID=UPI00082CAF4D|nr:glycosyltransferase [Hydrotalea flava]RTL49068.1 MAG: glycosyltransferase [Sphingobacteriales bacterium]
MPVKILIFNPYFYPGYKAGGPVQSLTHLIERMGDVYTFAVVTSAFDLGEQQSYTVIQTDTWQVVQLNGHNVMVWYAAQPLTAAAVRQRIAEQKPDIIYLNGMYGFPWFIWPLWWYRRGKTGNARVVVCPRGMLQPGALAVKPLRKKIYLTALRWLGLCKGIRWHATTPEEAKDIKQMMGAEIEVRVAANIPKLPVPYWEPAAKLPDTLRLVYVSLITQKKNLFLLLQALRHCKCRIYLDIWGPLVDAAYWQQCEKLIPQLPANISVQYKGTVLPQQVQATIAQYDAMVLLTKGENFGHVIYESFSAARPVLMSTFTPWQNLEARQAGWAIAITDTKAIARQIDRLSSMPAPEWAVYCAGAYALAMAYLSQNNAELAYGQLFDTVKEA